MLEEIVDPILLHQPGDKIESRFAALHAIFEFRKIRTLHAHIEIVEAEIVKYLLQDVDDREVLENPEVGGELQEGKKRNDLRPKHPEVSMNVAGLEVADEAGPEAVFVRVSSELDADRGAGADHVGRLELFV